MQAAADAGPKAVGHLEALIRLALFFNAADCYQLNAVVTRALFPEMPSKSGLSGWPKGFITGCRALDPWHRNGLRLPFPGLFSGHMWNRVHDFRAVDEHLLPEDMTIPHLVAALKLQLATHYPFHLINLRRQHGFEIIGSEIGR